MGRYRGKFTSIDQHKVECRIKIRNVFLWFFLLILIAVLFVLISCVIYTNGVL